MNFSVKYEQKHTKVLSIYAYILCMHDLNTKKSMLFRSVAVCSDVFFREAFSWQPMLVLSFSN